MYTEPEKFVVTQVLFATSAAMEDSTETATEGEREEYAYYISYSYVQNDQDNCA